MPEYNTAWTVEQSSDPRKSLGYQVRRCHRQFDRVLGHRLASHGVKTGAWYYLRILWTQDGLTQRLLSEMTHVAENTTAAIIKGMLADGLVERHRDPQNRRKVRITLTEKGRGLEEQIKPYAALINGIAAEGISSQEIDSCLATLVKLSENLEMEFARVSSDALRHLQQAVS